MNCFIFLAFSLFLAQVPFYIFHGCIFFCNNFCHLSFLLCFIFVVFAGCVCFFVGVSASDSTSSFLSLSWLLSSCFFVLFSFFFFAFYVFFSCCLSYPLPVFSFSYVSFCDSPLSCSYVSFCPLFSFCISFDFFCFVFFFSLFLLLLIFCLFFSPGPRVRLKRNTNEKNNYLILFAFRGSLRKCPLRKVIVYLFFWWISFCSQNMYLLDIVGICSEGVRDSLLLLICCYIVVLVFGEEPSFSPTCLLCQHFWDSFCFVFVFFFLGASASFEFSWGLFFCFAYLPHLGLLLLRCRWSYWFFNLISWLLVCASRFRCCHFVLNLVGGACG